MLHVIWNYTTNYIPDYFYSDKTLQNIKVKFNQVEFIKKALLCDMLHYENININLPIKGKYISNVNIYLNSNDTHIESLMCLGNCITDNPFNSSVDELFKSIYPGDIIIFIGQADIKTIKKLLQYDVALVVVPVDFICYPRRPDNLTFIQWKYFYRYDIIIRLMPRKLKLPMNYYFRKKRVNNVNQETRRIGEANSIKYLVTPHPIEEYPPNTISYDGYQSPNLFSYNSLNQMCEQYYFPEYLIYS